MRTHKAAEKHADVWPGINEGTKYVFSKSIDNTDPLITGWDGSVAVSSVDEIREIKNAEGPDIQVWGSSKLAQLLFENDLVDELRLKIHPITLGNGKKLFEKGTIPAAFKLVESTVTPLGVIIATFKRAGEVKTGDMSV